MQKLTWFRVSRLEHVYYFGYRGESRVPVFICRSPFNPPDLPYGVFTVHAEFEGAITGGLFRTLKEAKSRALELLAQVAED